MLTLWSNILIDVRISRDHLAFIFIPSEMCLDNFVWGGASRKKVTNYTKLYA